MFSSKSSLNFNLWLSILSVLISSVSLSGLVCLSNPCVHGVCVDENDFQYSCYCIDGYTGVQCQTNWDECWSSPCQNGGICVDGIASFNCTCPPGFVGDLCEENFDECESNPCQNNGTCIDAMNGYICNCPPGYLGIHCEVDVAVCNTSAETRCANGGECAEGPGMTFTCKCSKGWGGFLCDVEINECMSDPCQNGAICIDLHADYACACRFGFSGKNCEEKVIFCENNPCHNGALCLIEENHPICYCVPDYHGEKCEFQYDECQLGPRCFNGGTCIDGVDSFSCSCPAKLTGSYCECLIISDEETDCSYISTTVSITPSTNLTTAISTFPTSTEAEELTTIASSTLISTLMSSTIVPNTSLDIFKSTTTILTISDSETEFPSMSTSLALTSTESRNDSFETAETFTTLSEIMTETTTEMISFERNITENVLISTDTTVEVKSTATTLQIIDEVEYESTTLGQSSFDGTETSITLTTEKSFLSSSTLEAISFSDKTSPTETIYETTELFDYSSVEHITSETSTTKLFFTETPKTTTEIPTTTAFGVTELTTIVSENITETAAYPDCRRDENQCLNGGICSFDNQGSKCICSFNTEGSQCEIKKEIKNPAFGGKSYLIHHLKNLTEVEIQFTAKTVAENGLLLHSTMDGSYMSLYLERGFLKFKFSCGYQTMLLSELKNPINNGFDTIIYAKLEFDLFRNRCFSFVKVNNTLNMSGDQIALVGKSLRHSSWLYLGGIPEEYSDHLPSTGFIGCISNLKISGLNKHIYQDAHDGQQITECTSLACLSNPCKNGGSCTSQNKKWICLCKNGFLGKTCEKSICENNPCLFGGTCLSFTGSGYVCLCPFGKRGHLCENDLQISEVFFSPTINGYSSFSAYPIPPGAISNSMELKFKFSPTTMDQISILMFIGQAGMHDAASDHMAVSFVKGFIMLTWSLGAGPRRIFTSKPIEKDKDEYLVKIGRSGKAAWLAVDGLGNVTGKSKGKFVQLDVVPMLYLGGHDSIYFSTLPHDLPLHSGFSGCIFNVELKAGSVIIPLQSSRHAIGRAIGQCEISECHEKSCHNGGICLNHAGTFSCICQDDWFGPLCSLNYNPCNENRHNCSEGSTCVPTDNYYECDCPFDKTGKYCENSTYLTDIAFSGIRSFLSLFKTEIQPEKFDVQFELRPLHNAGLILFIGGIGKDFICLSIQSGFLEARILPANNVHNANEVLILRSKKLLAMGVWYNVRIGKFGRKFYVTVDDISNVIILHKFDYFRTTESSIFFGGLPDMSKVPYNAISTLPIPFKGCLRQLKIDSKSLDFNTSTVKESRNIDDCDGTPCGGDYCKNGGVCWLDSRVRPHCSCKNFYSGVRCELPPKCHDGTCRNGGKCVNYFCTCTVGYTGALCETAIKVTTPQFMGNSYIILKKLDKKRDIGKGGVKYLYINFTTSDKNGLLFWGNKKENLIGIGLEAGHLKLVFTINNGSQTITEVPETESLADGLWHGLTITFKNEDLLVNIDDEKIFIRDKNSFVRDLFDFTDGTFYLGGLPTENNRTIWEQTRGIFHNFFQGCIKDFGMNNVIATADFSNYDGANIGVCNII